MKNLYKTIFSLVLFFCFFFVWLNVYIFSSAQSSLFELEHLPESYTTALIFWAGVHWDQLSLMYTDRALTALDLYFYEKVDTILISADNSFVDYDEVRPVRNFLIDRWVLSGDIYLDFAGFDSYDTLYRAKEIFGAKKLLLISQDFHLPRLLFICRWLELDCIGVRADRRNYINVRYNYARETLANMKAFLSILFDANPTFLGDEIPLTGASNAFWYDE